MRTYIMSLGTNIWKILVNGYNSNSTPPIDEVGKKASLNNAKAINVILCFLVESEFVKFMRCDAMK